MKTLNLKIVIEEYESIDELNKQDKKLLKSAWQASDSAYAPYSRFKVGAAVLLENGEIINGNNQENAAYPSGLCAERVALFYASSKYPEIGIRAIAVSVKSVRANLIKPASPCGSCRQVMAEYEHLHNSKIKIILGNPESKIQIIHGIDSLLPLGFDANNLK
jgi:cytidine deaminase